MSGSGTRWRNAAVLAATLAAAGCQTAPAPAQTDAQTGTQTGTPSGALGAATDPRADAPPLRLRIASYNVALNRATRDALIADPLDGDSRGAGVRQLLEHPLVLGSATDPAITPMGEGSLDQPGESASQQGDPRFDTADFGPRPGNLRVDYVLPSRAGFAWRGGGVVWPRDGAPLAEAARASDHRLVWVDLEILPLD